MSLSLKSLLLNKRNVDRHFMKRGLPKGNTFMKCWVKQNETNAFIIRFLKVFTILTCVVNFLEGDFPGDPVDKNLNINAGDMDLIPDLGRFLMPWSN